MILANKRAALQLRKVGSEVLVPLHGEHMFFLVVTFFAGRDKVSFYGFAAANEWNDVIHGELSRGDPCIAVIAPSSGALPFPPTAFAKLAGDGTLPSEIRA